MAVEINVTGEVVTAYLSGELDHHTAKEMREAIDTAIELNMPTLLILDFKDVTFMDSSGIGLVMGRYKLMKSLGGKIRVLNLSPGAYKVMCLAGLERLGEVRQKEDI
jgi:stage II sporulation protein AA (anti-sigma F factor antagonist)